METRNTITLSSKMWRKLLKFCAVDDFRPYLQYVTVIPAKHQIIASDGHGLICICNTALTEDKSQRINEEIKLYDMTNNRTVIAYKHRFIDPVAPWALDKKLLLSLISGSRSAVILDLNNKSFSFRGQTYNAESKEHGVKNRTKCINADLTYFTNAEPYKAGIYNDRGMLNMYKFLKCFDCGGIRIKPSFYKSHALFEFNFIDHAHNDNLSMRESLIAYFAISSVVN